MPERRLADPGAADDGDGKAWASVARYDDAYVDELKTRGGGGQGVQSEIAWGGVGGDGRFDTKKMFRSFGRMIPGTMDESDKQSVGNLGEVRGTGTH